MEITQGGGIRPPPPAVLDSKKPGLFRVNLEKYNLLLTPPAEIARETYGSVMHHLLSPLFHPIVQNFRKTDSFASEHSSHGKPNNIGFSLKGYILITVYTFGVSKQHSRVGTDRARPTQVFHCLGVVGTLMTVGVYDLEMRTK